VVYLSGSNLWTKNAVLLHHIAVGWSKTVQNIIEQNVLAAHIFFVLVNQGCNTCHDQIKVSVEVRSKCLYSECYYKQYHNGIIIIFVYIFL
jgi:hypothetical protein